MNANSYAFFDVDDTLIRLKSMFDFLPIWVNAAREPWRVSRFNALFSEARTRGDSREVLNRLYYQLFEGDRVTALADAGRVWFNARFIDEAPPWIARTVKRLKEHQHEGVSPVLVSGSMPALLTPIAEKLNVHHLLCTRQILDAEGCFTGEIGEPQSIGCGKAELIQEFLRKMRADPENCCAYGDDVSDVPMLEAVGTPVAVGSESRLMKIAQNRDWRQLPTGPMLF